MEKKELPRIIVGVTVHGTEEEETADELFERVQTMLKPLEADDVTLLEEDA